jgi:hypothetical protein
LKISADGINGSILCLTMLKKSNVCHLKLDLLYTGDSSSNKKPKRDFKINLRQKLLSMEDVEVTDTTRLSRFVDDLYSLEADQIVKVGEKPPMDTLFMQLTSFELVVSDIASRKFKLEVKQWKLGQPQLAGVSNDSLLLLFDKTKIFRIAKTKDYFKKRE